MVIKTDPFIFQQTHIMRLPIGVWLKTRESCEDHGSTAPVVIFSIIFSIRG
jgi:hypothetical protein